MEISLNGRSALITGGSRGLGLEIARQLADKGAKLNVKNNRGLTPLSTLTGRAEGANARRTEVLHPGTVELLRRLGAVE